ncbi:cwf18 pre-mRNA splicing factor-domain-containing protein [Microdochium trichocladiopsis]|uniref:Cwf18 pre-mRNA splicing factor-domain-containing protein n=1 Tax=Microdochium trichocladiopsis TaxID=1682393 RepID=A0A9P9BMH9_9PEZI|nr:cwf18 pre-mRNA splicing factor-domain-containing protein [Microdochium trichocladiopsis]KAH7026293.1 cwf18 pre-mRNA splicing factor-domain-containing protein [Microdochium trichocladiopsis]
MSSLASLSAATDDRKARLAKLKNLKRKQPADEHVAPESDREASAPAQAKVQSDDGEQPQDETMADSNGNGPSQDDESNLALRHISGRNYDPETRGAKLGFEAPPTLGMEGPTLEEQAAAVERDLRAKAAEDAKDADKGIDLFKLQPKKPNWDLKRDLDKKLEILNVRTDNAIAKLVRERIASSAKAGSAPGTSAGAVLGDGANVDGDALVEGLRQREREEQEEGQRESQDEDLV